MGQTSVLSGGLSLSLPFRWSRSDDDEHAKATGERLDVGPASFLVVRADTPTYVLLCSSSWLLAGLTPLPACCQGGPCPAGADTNKGTEIRLL